MSVPRLEPTVSMSPQIAQLNLRARLRETITPSQDATPKSSFKLDASAREPKPQAAARRTEAAQDRTRDLTASQGKDRSVDETASRSDTQPSEAKPDSTPSRSASEAKPAPSKHAAKSEKTRGDRSAPDKPDTAAEATNEAPDAATQATAEGQQAAATEAEGTSEKADQPHEVQAGLAMPTVVPPPPPQTPVAPTASAAPQPGAAGDPEQAIAAAEKPATATATAHDTPVVAEAPAVATTETAKTSTQGQVTFASLLDTPHDSATSVPSQPILTPAGVKAADATSQAASPTTPTAAAPPTPLGAVPMTIGLRAMEGVNRFEIRLDPAELGRIDVKLDIDTDSGAVSADLIVDRPATLALLQRDASVLQQALSQAGFDASSGINLSLRDGNASGGQNQGQDRNPTGSPGTPAQPDFTDPSDLVPQTALRLTGIDIRI